MKKNILLVISFILIAVSILVYFFYTSAEVRLSELEFFLAIYGFAVMGVAFLVIYVQQKTEKLWVSLLAGMSAIIMIAVIDVIILIFTALGGM